MTSGWYFKEPLRNETKNFLISKFCFPWLVFTVTPSNSTHCYLTSSILPFNTETTKNFPAEKKTTENLRMCSVTWQSTLGESSTLNGENNSSFTIQIGTGDWLSCEIWTTVISIWNNHRCAEGIENRKEDWPWECPFTKRGSVAVYPRSLRA